MQPVKVAGNWQELCNLLLAVFTDNIFRLK